MTVIPLRFEEVWHESKEFPGVKYLLKPFGNIVRTKIITDNSMLNADGSSTTYNADLALDSVAYVLRGIEGVEGWEAAFETVKLRGGKTVKKLSFDSLDSIPPKIFDELIRMSQEITGLTASEEEEVKNTHGSPQTTDTQSAGTATETPITVPPESAPIQPDIPSSTDGKSE